MKKIILLLSTLIILAACGTSNDSAEASQEEQEPTEEEGNMNGESSNGDDLQAMIDQLKFTTDIVLEENQALFKMELTNNSEEDVEVSFSSGQKYEITVTDPETDEVVYKFSEGMMFTQAINYETIEPNSSLTWEQAWDYTSNGTQVDAKEYNVTVELLPREINKQGIQTKPFVNETTIEVPEKQSSETFRNVQVEGENGQYTITGEAKVFEGVFHYTVEDGHHMFIEEQKVQTEGAPSWGSFEIDVNIEKDQLPEYGVLSLILYNYDAKEGKQANHYPVTLENFNE
ncbi:BsuPI-related putative proteinase inhibitor [Tenuibacillus multivorans]|uniref:Immunoglobulin-like domain of spore germination n=1 Tax=Tenuibacillus multivorans TaxID=237069 RepID=A0A1G9ZZV4_9BACI|nr:BsuPI-related putative proteinase inhibitor [Tenuibacillus multivorans]GEL76909.1 hypothetical protein TMU01_11440 [Tenuibacillus multivorans]SDN26647.1 Immunoglobulin-like domain of spore germination [Tenuibacillus multivorans]